MPPLTPSHFLPSRVAPVPRLWPGSTIVCVGSGPSLTKADCRRLRDADPPVRVIAVNDAIDYVPWADVLFAGDASWWTRRRETPDTQLPALKFALQWTALAARPSVHVLNYTGQLGIEDQPTAVRTGRHSGYAAINVAVHLGARRIILLGYDLQPSATGANHVFGDHPGREGRALNYDAWLAAYQGLTDALASRGVAVINATRKTALAAEIVPRQTLAQLLGE
jgi:hypothetical protein